MNNHSSVDIEKNLFASVIMCNYNYGNFIAEAIESVLAQTYSDFELIVVDDGSDDNSREIISSFKDLKIKTIFSENKGQANAFNKAFKMAKGAIIAFIDSDDWWHPEKLEKCIKWHSFLEADYAILQHGLNVWHDGEQGPYKNILPVGNCFEEMLQTGGIDYFVPTSGLVFQKSVLEKIFPIPAEIKISADAYMMRSAFIFGKVYSIPDTLGYYRKHELNNVYKNKNFNVDELLQKIIFPSLNNFYKKNQINFRFDSAGNRKPSFVRKFLRSLAFILFRKNKPQINNYDAHRAWYEEGP